MAPLDAFTPAQLLPAVGGLYGDHRWLRHSFADCHWPRQRCGHGRSFGYSVLRRCLQADVDADGCDDTHQGNDDDNDGVDDSNDDCTTADFDLSADFDGDGCDDADEDNDDDDDGVDDSNDDCAG